MAACGMTRPAFFGRGDFSANALACNCASSIHTWRSETMNIKKSPFGTGTHPTSPEDSRLRYLPPHFTQCSVASQAPRWSSAWCAIILRTPRNFVSTQAKSLGQAVVPNCGLASTRCRPCRVLIQTSGTIPTGEGVSGKVL
jgi:hypothetical protein